MPGSFLTGYQAWVAPQYDLSAGLWSGNVLNYKRNGIRVGEVKREQQQAETARNRDVARALLVAGRTDGGADFATRGRGRRATRGA